MSSRAPDSLAFRSRLRSWRGFALLVILVVALGAFAIHMVVSAEILDLDYFKEINDRYGHEAGDRVLCVTASRMASQIRASDTIARFGGDEFIIILADILSASDAEGVAEKIRCAVAEPISLGHHNISITCSQGISLCPDDGIDFNTLRHSADLAMYKAKEDGRNTVVVTQG